MIRRRPRADRVAQGGHDRPDGRGGPAPVGPPDGPVGHVASRPARASCATRFGARTLRTLRTIALVAFVPVAVLAQERADTVDRAAQALARVRRLTTSDVPAARTLADSLVRAIPDAEPVQAEALFARASLAASAVEAERDYERVVQGHPLSPRVPDALMRLAVLESARNDRAAALRHLDRLLREHGDAPPRARASLLAARLRLEAGDLARGCDHLGAAYAAAGPTERDVREQATQLGSRCPVAPAALADGAMPPMGVVRGMPRAQPTAAARPATARPAAAPTRAQRDSAARALAAARRDSLTRAQATARAVQAAAQARLDSLARAREASTRDSARRAAAVAAVPAAPVSPATAPSAPAVPPSSPAAPVTAPVTAPTAAVARFAVQFAAYQQDAPAQAFAARLRAQGIPARVEGRAAPFRVRAGRFATEPEAQLARDGWTRAVPQAIVVPMAPDGGRAP